jgi:hypothetical protein
VRSHSSFFTRSPPLLSRKHQIARRRRRLQRVENLGKAKSVLSPPLFSLLSSHRFLPTPSNATRADFEWTSKAKWIDHLVVSGEEGVEGPEDINDDLARETHFYEQALASANVAIKKLKDLGIAVKRPDDFYAEMVKSDEHMKRVRAELIFEQTSQVSQRHDAKSNAPSQRQLLPLAPVVKPRN